MNTINNWICTDPDCSQYAKPLSQTKFQLIEMSLCSINPEKHEVYEDTIDIDDYIYHNGEDGRKELETILNTYGYFYFYPVKDHVSICSKYKGQAYQVMAECIFEYYGSFQASQLIITSTIEEAEEFIQEYISKN